MTTASIAATSHTGSPLSRLGALLLVLFVTACSSLPKDVTRVPSQAMPVDETSRVVQQLEPLLAANPGKSGFLTLNEGEQAFLVRLRMIAAAEKTIDIQYYIWHDDMTGRVMHNRLLDAADRGVRVRLLLDDLDTAGKDEILRKIDAHPNVEIRLFNPFANRGARLGDFIGDTRRVNRRMHNKTITVDNIGTVFGGRNIGDEYFDATEEVSFGDMDALGVGGIAQEVSAQFDLYWNSEYVYPIDAFNWDAPITEAEVAAFRKQSDMYMEDARQHRYADILRELNEQMATSVAEIDFVWSKWHLAFDQPRAIEMNEITAETHMAPKILVAMKQAKSDLVIVSPYFVPGESFSDFLVGLVDDGVRVRILTNSLQANDVSMVHAGYMRYRKQLIEGGVELFEFRSTSNKERRHMKRERMEVQKASLHAKYFTVDNAVVFVGSFNLDGRSAKLNTELGAYFGNPEEAQWLSENFDQIMDDLAYQVVLNDAGKLEWVGVENGREVRVNKEPDTTWWKRTSTRMLSWVVPESQL